MRSDWRLAGLVGLGGGEFRLPVLMYVVGHPARTAVPLNLAISLVTLTFALVVRSRAVSVAALVPYLNEVASLVSAIKSEHLIKTIAVLLAALGVLRCRRRCECVLWGAVELSSTRARRCVGGISRTT